MTCIPSLQSWCITPSKKDIYKFTKAHQYLQRNPAATRRVIDHDRVFYRHLSFFRMRIISYKNESESDLNLDILSNPSINESSLITAIDIINIIQKWNLVDVLDIQEEKNSDYSNSFIVIFKTAVSAHIMSKLKNFPELIQKNITIKTEFIDPIPENARVPLVYIQGIGPDVSDDAIRHFFRDMSFILKINRYQKGNIYFHIIKLPSVQNAINLSKQVNEGKFTRNNFASFDGSSYNSSNSSQSLIVTSHQYKSAITQCFFITSDEKTSLKSEDVHAEVSKFGNIDILFTRERNDLIEFYIKMSSLSDAKFACGVMNNRTFDNVTLKAIFISPEYFDDLCTEFKQENKVDSTKSIDGFEKSQEFQQNEISQSHQLFQDQQDQIPQQIQIQQNISFSRDYDVLQNQPNEDTTQKYTENIIQINPQNFIETRDLKIQSYHENQQNSEKDQNPESHEIIEKKIDQAISQDFEEAQNQENQQIFLEMPNQENEESQNQSYQENQQNLTEIPQNFTENHEIHED